MATKHHPTTLQWSPANFTMFPLNLHQLDRLARMALGVAMLLGGWLAEAGSLAFVMRVFALYPVITALAGWCPIYALLRFQTRR